MDEGSFGVCEGCNQKISMARLNALPYATFCIECQRENERNGVSESGIDDWSRLMDSGESEGDVSFSDLEIDA
jgi:DnaK suppressor protein